MFEPLESRRLLSIDLTGGLLTVTGTASPETILMSVTGAFLTVTQDMIVRRFPVASVTSITINADAGSDTITLGRGVIGATIDGGGGNDSIRGGPGNDTISGANGNDKINAGNGADTVSGGAGDDRLWGNNGADTLGGGDDTDYLNGSGGGDVLGGGAGADTADYAYVETALTLTLDDVANDGVGSGDNVQADVENVNGGAGDDLIVGNGSANLLTGNEGNDTLQGGGAADTLSGNLGTDLGVDVDDGMFGTAALDTIASIESFLRTA